MAQGPQAKRTIPRIEARKAQLRRMSVQERKALGLRLFAILSGQRAQKAYRMRGIDAMAHARKFRWPAKQAKPADGEQEQVKARSKVLPIG